MDLFSNKNAIKVSFSKGGEGGCLKSDIPVIDDFRFGKTVNETKTLGTTALHQNPIQEYSVLKAWHVINVKYKL